MNSVEIVETLPLKRNSWTVVTGFGGPGFIGNTAVMYIIRNKVFRLRAYLKSALIPPMMLVLDGKPERSFRIYSNDKEDIIFLASEIMLTSENAWTVCKGLMEWLSNKGGKEFISIEGMPIGTPFKERVVLGFSTDKDTTKFGVQAAREGAVSGLNACMMDWCIGKGLSWTSLFVPTNLLSTIDFGGAAAVVDVLNRMFKLGVDVGPLKEREEMLRQASEKQSKTPSGGFLGLRKKT